MSSSSSTPSSTTSYLWLTCPTGLEYCVEKECIQKLTNVNVNNITREIGKVIVKPFPKQLITNPEILWNFRGVDYILYGIVHEESNLFQNNDQSIALNSIRDVVSNVPVQEWQQAYEVWQKMPSNGKNIFDNNNNNNKQNIVINNNDDLLKKQEIKSPTYYVTKKRGGKHSFPSTTLGRTVWEGMNRTFTSNTNSLNWEGELGSNANLEIFSHLHEATLFVGLRLHKESLWKKSNALAENRKWVSTPMRPQICYGLLSETLLECGDIFCDPMVGCGTIGEVAAETNQSKIFCIVGDIDQNNVEKAYDNKSLKKNTSTMIDVIQWDASNLPLRDGVIDKMCTDLPFGKRCGSKTNNYNLYPQFLVDAARVLNHQNGRATLLSADRRTLPRAVDLAAGQKPFFKKQRNFTINVGGLDALTLVLKKRYYNEDRGNAIKEKQRRNFKIAMAKKEKRLKKRKMEKMMMMEEASVEKKKNKKVVEEEEEEVKEENSTTKTSR